MEQIPIALKKIFPQWEKLTPQQQQLVRVQTHSKHSARDQILRQGHNDCSGPLLVCGGRLHVFIESSGDKEATLYRLFSWDICPLSVSCIMRNTNFELHVQAERDSGVFIVFPALYENPMKESPPVVDYTSQLMASRFSDVMQMMEQILFMSFNSRLSAFLLEQSEIEGSDPLITTHKEIAGYLGDACEVVSHVLEYFSDDGLVQPSRGRATLLGSKRPRVLVQ